LWWLNSSKDHPNIGLDIDVALVAVERPYGINPLIGSDGLSDEGSAKIAQVFSSIPADKIFAIDMSDIIPPRPPLLGGSALDGFAKAAFTGMEPLAWLAGAPVLPYIGRAIGEGVNGPSDQGAGRVVDMLKLLVKNEFDGPTYFEPVEMLTHMSEDPAIPQKWAMAGKVAIEKIKQHLEE
jgi:hypothetical protein